MAHKKDLNEYRIVGDYAVLVFKTRKGEILEGYVSLPTLERLKQLNWCWCASWKKNINGYYAQHTEYLGTIGGTPKYKIHTLHQLIMPPKDGFLSDHINHNGLDNRMENLRYLNNADNVRSCRVHKNNTSGHRNVTWSKRENKWIVQLWIDGHYKRIGSSSDIEKAGQMAEEAREKYFGKPLKGGAK